MNSSHLNFILVNVEMNLIRYLYYYTSVEDSVMLVRETSLSIFWPKFGQYRRHLSRFS